MLTTQNLLPTLSTFDTGSITHKTGVPEEQLVGNHWVQDCCILLITGTWLHTQWSLIASLWCPIMRRRLLTGLFHAFDRSEDKWFRKFIVGDSKRYKNEPCHHCHNYHLLEDNRPWLIEVQLWWVIYLNICFYFGSWKPFHVKMRHIMASGVCVVLILVECF